MRRAILIDKVVGTTHPSLATAADVAAIEAVPVRDRLAAHSTYEALRLGMLANPAAPAIHFLPTCDPAEPGLVISHADYFARVTQAANMFHTLGVGPGDVVSFLLPLIPQALYTVFGAEAAGISNPVNPLLEPHQIAEILEAANTKVLVALGPTEGTDIWQKVEKLRGSLKNLKAIVQVGTASDETHGIYNFDTMLAKMPSDRLLGNRIINADDVAAYFHTGGTTGTPKLVRHTHLNQVFQAWVINTMLPAPAAPLLFGLPLFHVGGSLTQSLPTLANGGCLVVLSGAGWRNSNAVRNLWQLVERFKPPVFSAVPTVLTAAAAVPVGDADVSSLRFIGGGGSAIPVAVAKTLQDRFHVPVLEVYGMTETASVHTISYFDREVRLGTVGQPVPYSRVRVVRIDGDGRYTGDCGVDEIGVVAMGGPGVFSGYLNPVHNANAFVEPGWVNSGDLGRLDAQGYLWITGRAKDLIIRGGHNIDPQPLEEIFYQHPDVALAALVGQPDSYAGELPLAYVQLKPGATTTAAELHDYIRQRTPERAAVPVQVLLTDAVPLTAVGKVFKPQLRWDATRRVFTQTLSPLADEGVALTVSVGAHGTHGSLATVTVSGVPAAQRADIEQRIHQLLNPFVIRHDIVWQ